MEKETHMFIGMEISEDSGRPANDILRYRVLDDPTIVPGIVERNSNIIAYTIRSIKRGDDDGGLTKFSPFLESGVVYWTYGRDNLMKRLIKSTNVSYCVAFDEGGTIHNRAIKSMRERINSILMLHTGFKTSTGGGVFMNRGLEFYDGSRYIFSLRENFPDYVFS